MLPGYDNWKSYSRKKNPLWGSIHACWHAGIPFPGQGHLLESTLNVRVIYRKLPVFSFTPYHPLKKKKSGTLPASLVCKSWFHVWITSVRPLTWPVTTTDSIVYGPNSPTHLQFSQRDKYRTLPTTRTHLWLTGKAYWVTNLSPHMRGWILLLLWLMCSLSASPEVTRDNSPDFRNITVLRSLPRERPCKHSLLQTTLFAQINLPYSDHTVGLL